MSDIPETSFWTRHWKSILAIGTATIVATGIVVALRPKSSPPPPKKTQKRVKPKAATATATATPTPASPPPADGPKYPPHLFPEDLTSLHPEDRARLAKEAKDLGNTFYSKRMYADAAALYSQAIVLRPDAVYFSNRAACYANLNDYEKVVEDCTEALKLDPKYVKAMNRRAGAYEALNRLNDALNDFTSVCFLEEFKNQNTMDATDRVLKEIGKQKSVAIMKSKQIRLPSEAFILAYMDSFRQTSVHIPILLQFEPETEGDKKLQNSLAHIRDRQYSLAAEECEEAVRLGLSKQFAGLGYNIRGTFSFLKGDASAALEDFNKAVEVDEHNVNTLIKRASVFMERGDLERAVEEFNRAEQVNPEDPDLFYHRGQVRFLTNDLVGAAEDYEKALSLDNTMVYANIQLAVAQYKLGNLGDSDVTFTKALRRFKNSPEVCNYYGEILVDQGKFEEAEGMFEKALKLDSKSPLPYINKAILQLQWKKDYDGAIALCKEAINVDPLCDIAFVQLAQLQLQQNKIEDARSPSQGRNQKSLPPFRAAR
ncbi:hypothetical protein BJ742DRAFT_738047 [Cladochytrium replicatum]|nr:hypothetical protein BJ742DRAFT_738047 [Cladochytrium replicatum]